MQIVLVPHTHWDREWYVPYSMFEERLGVLMDELLDLLDAQPEFRHFHLDGQTALLDDYLAMRPGREADLRRHIAAGRLSVGPWFTQMDEFLTSGESQIRNLEWGRERAEAFGVPVSVDGPPVGYLPDQFGHVGQMPQLLRAAGIEHAVVWRGVPAAVDRTEFWWEAPDGSRVLTYYFIDGYDLKLRNAEAAHHFAGQLRRLLARTRPALARDAVIVPLGGDHQLGAFSQIPLVEDAALHLGHHVRVGSIASFLGGRPEAGLDALPVWRGELRSGARAPLLPNTYSVRVSQKRARGRLESLVERYAEPLAALVPGFRWPEEALREVWRRLLWNGAHDSVCGCSTDQVAADVDARASEAWGIAASVVGEAARTLAGVVGPAQAPGEVVTFNPSPFARDGVPGLGWAIRGHGGRGGAAGPVAATAAAPMSEVYGLPGGEGPGWRFVRPAGRPIPLRVAGDRIILDDLELRLVDEPDAGDLYTYCPVPGRDFGPPDLSLRGDEVVALWGEYQLRVILRATRSEGEPFVRVSGWIDSRRRDHRLWLRAAIAPGTATSLAASPFELVERGRSSEGGRYEPPSPSWPAQGAVLAGGLGLFSEGVVEYEVADGELGVVLMRATGRISHASLATRRRKAGPGIPTPRAQMSGRTGFSLALEPGATRETLIDDWERFALPLLAVEMRAGRRAPNPTSRRRGQLLRVTGARLSSARRVDGHLQVRIWNETSQHCTAHVADRAVPLGPHRIATVRLPDQ